MGKSYDLWNNFFESLPKIKSHIESAALKNGLDTDIALLLVAISNYPDLKLSADQNSIKVLCDKGLCEYNENTLKATPRGNILAKSLTMTLKMI